MVANTSMFFNEAEVSFKFDWRCPSELPADVNVQVNMIGNKSSYERGKVVVQSKGGWVVQEWKLRKVRRPCQFKYFDSFAYYALFKSVKV